MENLFLDACEQGLTSTILKYIRKSNDVNLTDSNGCTGLMKACLNGHYEIIKILLDANADINKKDFHGQNALHYAIRANNEKVVKLLLGNKIDANQKTKSTNMLPLNYSIPTVPNELTNSNPIKFIEKSYIKQSKSIQQSLDDECIMQKANQFFNEFAEDRILNMINRYNDMVLSDLESDGDDEPKGEVYKKSKKKKKGKKKSSKKGGGKKGKKKKK